LSSALPALAEELRTEGSVISPYVRGADGLASEPGALGALAAAGPRTSARGDLYAVVVESVREGYLLHYGRPRLIDPPDADLALLAGDYLYAKGLGLLAAEGDLASVRLLADLISASAELHADGTTPSTAADAGALWLATAVALAVDPAEGEPGGAIGIRDAGDAQGLYAQAARLAAQAGVDEHLAAAAETVGFHPFDRG
jgi:hypothetical protein